MYEFDFTYALTFIHTLVTMAGMQLFLKVRFLTRMRIGFWAGGAGEKGPRGVKERGGNAAVEEG